MLDALPPAQQQQALRAIRDLRSQEIQASSTSINDVDSSANADLSLTPLPIAEIEKEPRAGSRSRLVINFSRSEDLSPADEKIIDTDPVLQRLIGSHLFVLDDAGVLSLQGLELIPLLGLSEDDIGRRLQAESSLSLFDIDVRILDQTPIGVEALEPFGYSVFEPNENGIGAPSSGPVPSNYVIGPGDNVRVQFFGNVNGIHEYEVTRDGILSLPEIGPVAVGGTTFSALRDDLNNRVQEMLIGTQVSVTMGALRTIRVFVLGDANQPGSYVVGGLATISSALYRSGGISQVGSLRNIQLKRNGRVVTRLDLYDLLVNGDTSGDRRLLPGDVIFVPPIGDTVAVGGAVKRPAIYETRGETTVAEIVDIAGGLANDAFPQGARLERIDEASGRTVVAVSLDDEQSSATRVRSGDTVLVPEVLPDFDGAVDLSGHVYRPGKYPWTPGLRIADLLSSPSLLKPGVDNSYVLIRRERLRGEPIDVISADLGAALALQSSAANISLQQRDQIHVFSLDLGRQRVVALIIDELQMQATHDTPSRQVEIGGDVRVPGVYPLETGMRIGDLLRAGGGLAEEAYALEAELSRYSVVNGESRVVDVFDVDLAGVLRGDSDANVGLSPYDYLSISRVPDWDTQWTVTLEGEVKFPGEYRVSRRETLSDLLVRAGGLTDSAFAEGVVFLRESLREREQEQIQLLARRLEADLTSLSLQLADTSGSETLATGKALLDQLRETKAVGRLVISSHHLRPNSRRAGARIDIEMRDGDRLLVPTRSQVVTVIGETQQNTSHLYLPGLSRNDYINLSGGLTQRADRKRIYVVRANGAVVTGSRSKWLGRGSGIEIMPGDTVVVPLDADKMRPLTFWTNVTQILYQGAIAIAAVRTFDN